MINIKNFKVKQIFDWLYYVIAGIIIILGIYLRTKNYLQAIPVWHDELYTVNTLLFRSFTKLLLPCSEVHMSPPLFMAMVKIITKIAGAGVLQFRFVPYCFSCASIFVFFLLLKKIFVNKLTILASLFLFSINGMLIYYAQDTKPYSLDVFICILLLLNYEKFNIKEVKQLYLYCILGFIIPFMSFPSIIIIGTIIIAKIIELKTKQCVYYVITGISTLISALIIYIINNIHHSDMLPYFDEKVFTFSFSNLIYMTNKFLIYLHINSLVIAILLFLGIITLIITKNKLGIISIWIVIFTIIASFLHLYPFDGRAILFLCPIYLLFITAISDINFINVKIKKITPFLSLLIISLLFISLGNRLTYIDQNDDHFLSTQERQKKEKFFIHFFNNYKDNKKIYITWFYVEYMRYYNLIIGNKQLNYEDYETCTTVDELYNMFKKDKSSVFWIVGEKDNDCSFDTIELEDMLNKKNIKYEEYNYLDNYLIRVINNDI